VCRLAGLVASGELPLSTLLYDPPHSLQHQAYRPTSMRTGAVNVDGTGIAWFAGDAPEPLRFVTDAPPWSDANLPWLAPRLRAATQLAAVRSATAGIPYGTSAVAPFTFGPMAAVHNGYLEGYRDELAVAMLSALPPRVAAAQHVASDSLALFLVAVARRLAGATLAEAATGATVEVAERCRAAGRGARLNLALAEDGHVVALRASVGLSTNTLWTHQAAGRALTASEPLDDDAGWSEVAPGSLVQLTTDGVTVEPVPGLEGT
jgi:glutamine amidotransferase